MFQVLGIDHVVLRVADTDRALAFYGGVIGLAVEREQPEIGLTQLRAGASLIDLVAIDGPLGRAGGGSPARSAPNVDHFALQIAPYDEPALRAHLSRHGVEVVESGSRYGAGGEGPSIHVLDPDGNKLELKAAATPR